MIATSLAAEDFLSIYIGEDDKYHVEIMDELGGHMKGPEPGTRDARNNDVIARDAEEDEDGFQRVGCRRDRQGDRGNHRGRGGRRNRGGRGERSDRGKWERGRPAMTEGEQERLISNLNSVVENAENAEKTENEASDDTKPVGGGKGANSSAASEVSPRPSSDLSRSAWPKSRVVSYRDALATVRPKTVAKLNIEKKKDTTDVVSPVNSGSKGSAGTGVSAESDAQPLQQSTPRISRKSWADAPTDDEFEDLFRDSIDTTADAPVARQCDEIPVRATNEVDTVENTVKTTVVTAEKDGE